MLMLKNITREDVNQVLDFWYEIKCEAGREILDKSINDKDCAIACCDGKKIVGLIIFKIDEGFAEIKHLWYSENNKEKILEKLFWTIDETMCEGIMIYVPEEDVNTQVMLRDLGKFKWTATIKTNNHYLFEKHFKNDNKNEISLAV